jgi:hypothetical protein
LRPAAVGVNVMTDRGRDLHNGAVGSDGANLHPA